MTIVSEFYNKSSPKNIMKNKKKIEFGVPAFIPNKADGFKKASDEQTRQAIRSTVGKGDKRRVENVIKIRENWDEIDWSNK